MKIIEKASMKRLVGNAISVLLEVLIWIVFACCTTVGLYFSVATLSAIGPVSGLLLGAIAGILIKTGWHLIPVVQKARNYLKK
jgi:hypothetical protein